MRPGLSALILLGCGLLAPPLRAEGAAQGPPRVRTSLIWIFGDDDVLHAPGDTSPPSPGAGFGDRRGYDGLFEGQSSRYTGRENRSELVLEGTAPGPSPAWFTRARLALALDASSLGVRPAPLLASDAGSFIAAAWTFHAAVAGLPDALTLRAFPLNGDRERVGALEALAWGGAVGPASESPYAAARGAVRAARLELGAGLLLAHVGLKTATFLEPTASGPALEETSYGLYGGVESRWSAPLGVALGFGRFEHGRLPGDVSAPRATTVGASLRLHVGSGFLEPRPPLGFGTERSPFDTGDLPRDELVSTGGLAVSLEGAHLVQRRWDFDHPGGSALESARAVAAVAELKAGALDIRAAFTLRDPAFVLRNGPGAFSGETLPRAAGRRNELGGSLGVSVALGRHARPGLALGVLSPAALMTRAVDRLGQPIGASLVLRGPNELEALPPGAVPVPVVEVRPGLELRLSRLLEGLAWAAYRRDFNHTRLVPAAAGALGLGFQSPDRLGFGVAARAVW